MQVTGVGDKKVIIFNIKKDIERLDQKLVKTAQIAVQTAYVLFDPKTEKNRVKQLNL